MRNSYFYQLSQADRAIVREGFHDMRSGVVRAGGWLDTRDDLREYVGGLLDDYGNGHTVLVVSRKPPKGRSSPESTVIGEDGKGLFPDTAFRYRDYFPGELDDDAPRVDCTTPDACTRMNGAKCTAQPCGWIPPY